MNRHLDRRRRTCRRSGETPVFRLCFCRCLFSSKCLIPHRPRNRLISRRSRFEGRPPSTPTNCIPARRSSAAFARSALLSAVSRYSPCATAAGPRTSLSPNTSTEKSPPSFLTCKRSPTRTSRAALATTPFDSALPNSQALAASARVLKNLAAQSHLSIRTESILHLPLDRTHPSSPESTSNKTLQAASRDEDRKQSQRPASQKGEPHRARDCTSPDRGR